MSKGSRWRDAQVPERELENRWAQTFGRELRRVYETCAPMMLEDLRERARPMRDRAIDAGLLEATRTPSCDTLTGHCDVRGCEPLPPAGLVEPPSPVTLEPE